MNLTAQIVPEMMGQTYITVVAITLATTTGRINRFIHSINNFGNTDGITALTAYRPRVVSRIIFSRNDELKIQVRLLCKNQVFQSIK